VRAVAESRGGANNRRDKTPRWGLFKNFIGEWEMPSHIGSIDATLEVVTPENIAFHYQVAGPFRRLPAFLLDVCIRMAIFLSFTMTLGFFGVLANLQGLTSALVIVAWFVLDWFYGGVLEIVFNGQTFGKRVMGLRVLTVDGEPITAVQAIMRNFLRFADMMPMLSLEVFSISAAAYMIPTFVVALVTMTMNRRYQRLGDLVCGTVVVVEERSWLAGVAELEDPRAKQLANYVPADFRVSRTLARALSDYVDRRRYFSPARRREIARHVAAPLVVQFGFPLDTSYDLVLCALYYRAFIADRDADERPWEPTGALTESQPV
jgi:uncharacterized RDD family membrane protein YckC